MKSATRVLCCTIAAFPFTGNLQAATLDAALTNPAAQSFEAELFPSIVPGAQADGQIIAVSCESDTACDSCCECSDGCCGCGDGCCDCGDGCGCGQGVGWMGTSCASPWKASLGGVVLTRSQPVPSIIAQQVAGANVRAGEFSIGTTVGVDMTLARRLTDNGGLEARYLGALEWDPRGSLSQLTGNMNIGGINIAGITDIGGGYNSTLHSSELNWRHQQTDRFSWLVGGRWIELQDTVDFFVTTGGGTQSLSWNTNNHLYGGQVGADYMFWQSTRRPLSVAGSGKAGLYGNQADNDFAQRINGVRVGQGGGIDTDVAFVTEAAAWVAYQYSERITFRGGGQILYIDEVALGSDQIARAFVMGNPNGVDASGYVWYFGGLLSVDYVW